MEHGTDRVEESNARASVVAPRTGRVRDRGHPRPLRPVAPREPSDCEEWLPNVGCPVTQRLRHIGPDRSKHIHLDVTGQILAPVERAQYLAEHIPGAKFVQLPGSDLSFTTANAVVADEIAEFLTGERLVI